MTDQQSSFKPPLLTEFEPASYESWQEAAKSQLAALPAGEKSFEPAGLPLPWQPIFRAEDISDLPFLNSNPGDFPFVRGRHPVAESNSTLLMEQLSLADPAQFNLAAREGLAHGMTALRLSLDRAGRLGLDPDEALVGDVGWDGLSLPTRAALDQALEGIDLEITPIFLQAGPSALGLASFLVSLARQRSIDPANLQGLIGYDPIGELAAHGELSIDSERAYDELAGLITSLTASPRLKTLLVSVRAYQHAALAASEQLAILVATAVSYLRAMEARSLKLDDLASELSFELAVGSNQFTEMAKLRACRLLWSRVAQLCHLPENSCPEIHVVTSETTRTTLDRHLNILRGTNEALAAMIGGCDSLTILPLDQAMASRDRFHARLARNTQHILIEECRLKAVADPAGGSYYIEWLTANLAEEGWRRFIEIEKMGGMLPALQKGMIQQWMGARLARRCERLARRRDIIVGINKYINLSESNPEPLLPDPEKFHREQSEIVSQHRQAQDAQALQESLDKIPPPNSNATSSILAMMQPASEQSATLGQLNQALRGENKTRQKVGSLPPFRPSEMFEQLRHGVEKSIQSGLESPTLFLAAVGKINHLQARIEFVKEFFAIAGWDLIFDRVYTTADEALWAASEADPRLVLICASDRDYPEIIPAMLDQLSEKLPDSLICLAGYPTDLVDQFQQAGVDEFIYDGADAQALLTRLTYRLGGGGEVQ